MSSTSITRTINADGTVATETRDEATTTYGYDTGRLASVVPAAGATTYLTYDADGESATTARGPTWTTTFLDGFGRPIGTENAVGVKTTVEYDADGRKSFESYPFTGSSHAGGEAFEYDALNRVVQIDSQRYGLALVNFGAAIATGDTVTAAPLLAVRAALDAIAPYTWPSEVADPAQPLATGQPIRAVHINELRDRIRALQAAASVRFFYHLDALGSVRAVTNQAGDTVRRHDYAPFGEEPSSAVGADSRRFTGKERDTETGLDYFSARYYAAGTGRFVSADPGHVGGDVFDTQSWNAYAYSRNNPLRFVDPAGTDYYVTAEGGTSYWFEGSWGAFGAHATGFRLDGDAFGGVIRDASGRQVGTYKYYDLLARLLTDIAHRSRLAEHIAGVGVGFTGIATGAGAGAVIGAGRTVLTGLLLRTGIGVSSLTRPLGMSNAAFGRLIGWTTGGSAATNLNATRNLIAHLPSRARARAELIKL